VRRSGQAAAPGQGRRAPESPAVAGQARAPRLTAKFLPVQTGIRDGEHIEITRGLQDGARVITTGAGALKDGDRIVAATREGRGGRGREGGRRSAPLAKDRQP
jgi:hypothetical protein